MSQAGSKFQSPYRTVPQQEDRVCSYLTGHKGWACVLPTGRQLVSSSVFLESLMLLLHRAISSGKFPGFWGVSVERQGPARSMLGTGLVPTTWQLKDAG